jgi:hypothetical protein
MATYNWKIIYRDYTAAELAEEKAFLRKESRSIYLSQAVGSKNYQRSITTIEERLRAIAEIERENGNRDYLETSYVDFGHHGDSLGIFANRNSNEGIE